MYKTGMLASKQLFYIASLDSTSIDTTQNVPDFLPPQSFWPFFKINVKIKIFGSAEYMYILSPTAMVLNVFTVFLFVTLCYMVICSEIGLQTWLYQRTAHFLRFSQ